MSKVDLAKKTAKLMIDKLSPKELENELYQLLIILSNNDLDYMYKDVKKGEVAGPPHPVDVLQGSDDRDDDDSSLGKVTIYHDEGNAEIKIDKRDALKLLKKGLLQAEEEPDDDDPVYMYYGEGWGGLEKELGYLPMGAISENEDDEVEILNSEKYKDFAIGDFVYAYDDGMDRWLPYTIEGFKDGTKSPFVILKEYFVGAPSGDVGQETINYDGELRAQPESEVFLLNDYLYKNNGKDFVKYIQHQDGQAEEDSGGPLIKDIYIDHGGIVNIEWTDNRESMDGYLTQATPFWQGEDEIGVQVSHNESGEVLPTGETVYWPNSESFNIGNAVYPNDPDDFYYAYWELIPEIFELSLKIVEENEDYVKDLLAEENPHKRNETQNINKQKELDKALEKWDEKGGKSLTKKEKNLITSSQLFNGNNMPIDYGWHKAVRSFIEMYDVHPDGNKIPAKYKNTSLDEIPRSLFIAPDEDTGEVISNEHAMDRADTFEIQYVIFMDNAEEGTYNAGDWYGDDLLLYTPWGGEEELYEE